MPRFSQSIRVPYQPADCFQLVSDIARYPQFIKWITAMRVTGQRDIGPGVTECQGEAVVGFKGFTERFTTQVVADEAAARVFAEWRIFETVGGGADISLEIDYEFRNPVIGFLAAANHDLAVDRILNAFLVEAQARFGKNASQ
jgi:coenzyme Q-binding protein COQ10